MCCPVDVGFTLCGLIEQAVQYAKSHLSASSDQGVASKDREHFGPHEQGGDFA
jgi:hypothetical protein